MSVEAIVRKDLRDGIRSWLLLALMVLFALVLGGASLLVTQGGTESQTNPVGILALGAAVFVTVLVLVPITGLVVSIKSIVREREVGTVKVLLSLPHSRGEVLAGKFLGRSALLTAAILAGFLPAGLIFWLRVEGFPIVQFGMFALVAILVGLQFVAVGLAASALVDSEAQATFAGVGLFFVMLTWRRIFGFLNGNLNLLSGDAKLFVERFHLFTLFNDMLRALASLQEDLPSNASTVFPAGHPDTVQRGFRYVVVENQPFYLAHWFAFVLVAVLIAAPLALAYVRFDRMDL